jgi:hypothetical protein
VSKGSGYKSLAVQPVDAVATRLGTSLKATGSDDNVPWPVTRGDLLCLIDTYFLVVCVTQFASGTLYVTALNSKGRWAAFTLSVDVDGWIGFRLVSKARSAKMVTSEL